MYFGVHYVFGQGITFLIPTKQRHWILEPYVISNAFGGVHYGKYEQLCLVIALHNVLIPHNTLHVLLITQRQLIKKGDQTTFDFYHLRYTRLI